MFEFFASEYGFKIADVAEMTLAQMELYFEKAVQRNSRMLGDEEKQIDISQGINLTENNSDFLKGFGVGFRKG